MDEPLPYQPSPKDLRRQKAIEVQESLKRLTDGFVPVKDCPLVTPYTRFRKIPDSTMGELYRIRKGGEFEMPPTPKLRTEIDGGKPFNLRGYQKQQAVSMAKMPRYINGDSVGLGKTCSAIAAACAVDAALGGDKIKMIVFTTTSTSSQWATEIKRFSHLRPWIMQDSYKFKGETKKVYGHAARVMQMQKFLEHPRLDVLICRYSQWVGRRETIGQLVDETTGQVTALKEEISKEALELEAILEGYRSRSILVLDETHLLKNPKAQVRALIVAISKRFKHVWGLTATAIVNNLEEFYSILSAIGIFPLGSLSYFREHYCEWKAVRKGRFVDYVITGYRQIPEFKRGMRPWYWGRSQAQVGESLPKLTTLYHPINLSAAESKLLLEDIPSGLYVLPPSVKMVSGVMEFIDRDPSNLMTSLSVMQAVANSYALLEPDNPKVFLNAKLSAKEEMILDMLDGDLKGEHVLLFSKSRSWISRMEQLTAKGKFTDRNFLRITGAETGPQREVNRLKFQNNPDYNFIAINSAAIEGVNLQQASHLIAADLPWSWGKMLQLVGRMVRMASPHSACTLHILMTNGTVDEYVVDTLMTKKGVFERILGAAGTLGLMDDNHDLASSIDLMAQGLEDESEDKFLDMLKAHAKKVGLRPYAFGDILAKDVAGLRKRNVKGPSKQLQDRSVSIEDISDRW